ncbi:UTP--glucose-1-phosphate uridylyltransferase [Candidatus Kaiserbacteria bacterium CG10_big_fil_rev_8_21_14_0_10_59_10]|uniref:UTP--glucose-1-phosphate uridylyltransferase n=1 Tax=Candidatus Kaiserbacteria bacterium CG10_big_fil_rev_8_21_14_0_10_59_10 TaxID=1974612 RepID=A0A2H0U6X5_9BACT|nr:MAG: UTP--glucose-1-phosphate uridylyltransferase [Candidatus Kaiserbacteria bacterium CG10_big_fil_rev_8_21_14_0_10_59_10]
MHKNRAVTKVIIPVAGSGTRFLPATKAQPKEMLPVIDKPVIQYLVEEAVEAGITDIIFITGRNKRAIEDHFDASPELEAQLENNGKEEVLERIRRVSELARFSYVRQRAPLGDGDAILTAEHLVDDDEPVGVMFGDDIFVGSAPRLTQIGAVYAERGEVVAALEEVPREEVSRYGVVDGEDIGGGVFDIKTIVEKPKVEEAPSNMILMGTYIINKDVFRELRSLKERTTEGEVRLADALKAYLAMRPVLGVRMDGKRYDCGDKLGYLKTTVDFALMHPEFKDDFRAYIREKVSE